MKPFVTLAVFASLLGGCVAVDPLASIELMQGKGSVTQSPNGDTSFNYYVHANAYKGVTNSPEELRKQHEWLIGKYLAEGKHCPRGYRITKSYIEPAVPAYVYEGVCR